MKKITVTSPGKLLLMGDHAVVYGHPSLVTAIDQRMTITVEPSEQELEIIAPQTNNTSFTKACIDVVQRRLGLSAIGIRIITESTFTGVYGFGSSSALVGGLLRALTLYEEKQYSSKELFDAAYEVVMKVQGVGSGFDVAAAIYGGSLYFVTGGKTIEPVAFLDDGKAELVVGYSGVKANTVDIVKQVAAKREQYPERVNRIFDGIGKLVEDGKRACENRDWERFGRLWTFDQEYLRDLGVSSQKLENLISASVKAGAYGAKLSGAGGGDCMIALVSPEKKEAVEAAIVKAGGEVVIATPNAPGAGPASTDDPNEQFVVVNENDVVVGSYSRGECHHDKRLIHRVIGVHVFDRTGRVLLQRRSLKKDLGAGLWGTATAGHVMKGEKYEQAAVREMQEELGIEAQLIPAGKIIVRDAAETEMVMIYTAQHEGPFRLNPDETDEVKFFTKDEISRGLLSGKFKLTECTYQALKELKFI